MSGTIVWFRQDLRIADNAALLAAAELGEPVLPVYIWDPASEGEWAPGSASRVWLEGSLGSLERALRERGSRLLFARGPVTHALRRLALESGARRVYWNRRHEPFAVERQLSLETDLAVTGVSAAEFPSGLLWEPEQISTTAGKPFQRFTPFWRACLSAPSPAPARPAPAVLRAPESWPSSEKLEALGISAGIHADYEFTPGENAAGAALDRFVSAAAAKYADGRDRPDLALTSQLSAHLRFGEISPRRVWQAVERFPEFRRQIVWREFAYHLLAAFPETPLSPLDQQFEAFPWREDPERLELWKQGQTGYPIVDAGMRQLLHTGWMHNRVRMIVASFLVKDLMIPWQQGAAWFWERLADADLANNTLGWQWCAGCGADAAPYFRIFNPVTQGKKFDPEGAYVRRWVQELAHLPAKRIHEPWLSGGALGYPPPIVDHANARARALDAWGELRAYRAAR